jgi:hypothetical protein
MGHQSFSWGRLHRPEMVTYRVRDRLDRQRSLTSTKSPSLVATNQVVSELSTKQFYPNFDGLTLFATVVGGLMHEHSRGVEAKRCEISQKCPPRPYTEPGWLIPNMHVPSLRDERLPRYSGSVAPQKTPKMQFKITQRFMNGSESGLK